MIQYIKNLFNYIKFYFVTHSHAQYSHFRSASSQYDTNLRSRDRTSRRSQAGGGSAEGACGTPGWRLREDA